MPYDPELVRPMRAELSEIGVRELLTPDQVDDFMSEKSGTAFLVVNSVCGCAAGSARPAVRMALSEGPAPDRCATVFAGQDLAATEKARGYFGDYPPSSPSFALFKDGALVHFFPRHRIEGRGPEDVAEDLRKAFAEHCGV
jgi:putative YphP/YqiW family bacilliredoxin